MPSREQKVIPLLDVCDLKDREDIRCYLARGCGRPAKYWVTWKQRNMSGFGWARFAKYACEKHGRRYAKKHGITLETP